MQPPPVPEVDLASRYGTADSDAAVATVDVADAAVAVANAAVADAALADANVLGSLLMLVDTFVVLNPTEKYWVILAWSAFQL